MTTIRIISYRSAYVPSTIPFAPACGRLWFHSTSWRLEPCTPCRNSTPPVSPLSSSSAEAYLSAPCSTDLRITQWDPLLYAVPLAQSTPPLAIFCSCSSMGQRFARIRLPTQTNSRLLWLLPRPSSATSCTLAISLWLRLAFRCSAHPYLPPRTTPRRAPLVTSETSACRRW